MRRTKYCLLVPWHSETFPSELICNYASHRHRQLVDSALPQDHCLHRWNSQTDIQASSEIRTHDPSVWEGEATMNIQLIDQKCCGILVLNNKFSTTVEFTRTDRICWNEATYCSSSWVQHEKECHLVSICSGLWLLYQHKILVTFGMRSSAATSPFTSNGKGAISLQARTILVSFIRRNVPPVWRGDRISPS
jgi:hypothetical protein